MRTETVPRAPNRRAARSLRSPAALACALIVLGFGASVALAASPGAWQIPAADISGTGSAAAAPQIAIAPDGSATAVWVRSDGANDIVQAATQQPGHAFATPVDLSATGENADSPQVTTGPDGTVTVVWQRGAGPNQVIQSATRPPGGFVSSP